ncbi:hypothetical protein ETAE_0938 [Edwardsiella piscicida]|uniref:Uncharacterized protein n=1 Tax=Edwardsiella piscicida TaxID=1263550 RepID=A0AAU8PC69_EDWPI|nr:hypothetical protein ETAE_0938 [Edwardsiella tarda EIB202]
MGYALFIAMLCGTRPLHAPWPRVCRRWQANHNGHTAAL